MIDRELLDDVHFAILEHGRNWHTEFDADEINTVSAYWHALEKDTPAKMWWDLPVWHPATGRALRIDRSQDGGAYAVLPFRLGRIDDRPVILVAYPCPLFLSNCTDVDWLDIEDVIAWDPVHDSATVIGDPAPQLVGRLSEDANQIHASPRAFFQAWAIRRAAFAVQWQSLVGKTWASPPTERDEVPGALVVGDIDRVTLAPSLLPTHIESVGIDPKTVNRAIMRSARLPRVTGAELRRAA